MYDVLQMKKKLQLYVQGLYKSIFYLFTNINNNKCKAHYIGAEDVGYVLQFFNAMTVGRNTY
jgi:hypothetical protein